MTVKDFMDEIVNFDCSPSVFRVSLRCADNYSGYTATVEFRSGHGEPDRSIRSTCDTPEMALDSVLLDLKRGYGKCAQCGTYLQPDSD